jgi:hypothetical protein
MVLPNLRIEAAVNTVLEDMARARESSAAFSAVRTTYSCGQVAA